MRLIDDDEVTVDRAPDIYKPYRTAIQAVLKRSLASCGESDRKRAADRMGRLIRGKPDLDDDPMSRGMLFDLSLFEQNDRGVRAFDRFLSGAARHLPDLEQDMARRIGAAFYSIFRIIEPHAEGGIWVQDILDRDRRIWLIDQVATSNKAIGQEFATRIFDVGPFHATVGPIIPPNENLVEVCRKAIAGLGRLPFKRSLAATVYGIDYIDETISSHPSGMKFARDLYDAYKRTGAYPQTGQGRPAFRG